jgi:histone H2A
LTVVQGDVVQMEADAIVHPTGSSLAFGGEVGRALGKAGGRELKQEITDLRSAKGSLEEAGVAICPAHNIPAKFVIHVNSPTWNLTNAQTNLEKAIRNILALADEKNLKVVALPSVSSGGAGFPKQTAAQIILRTISNYFVSVVTSSLRQIYFVLYDMESIGVYTSELAKLEN